MAALLPLTDNDVFFGTIFWGILLMKRLALSAALLSVALWATPASASSLTIGLTNGSRSASAVFVNSGGQLIVTLTNTSTADALVPTDLLTAIFFDVAGSPTLTPVSAVICSTCSVLYPGSPATDAGGSVGGEWAYLGGGADLAFTANYALSSTGVGIFGPGDVFGGTNLAGPADPDGPQYGITTAGDDPATFNARVDVCVADLAVDGQGDLGHGRVVLRRSAIAYFKMVQRLAVEVQRHGHRLPETPVTAPATSGALTERPLRHAVVPRKHWSHDF